MLETRNVSLGRHTRFVLCSLVLSLVIGYATSVSEVAAANSPPRIVDVSTVIYGGMVYVFGYVIDDDDNVSGYTVYFDGDISGTAKVKPDGTFWFRKPYYLPYGEGSVVTQDPHGNQSAIVYFEFFE